MIRRESPNKQTNKQKKDPLLIRNPRVVDQKHGPHGPRFRDGEGHTAWIRAPLGGH